MSVELFPWIEHFDTGLPEVDVEHRSLISRLNLLAAEFAFAIDELDAQRSFDGTGYLLEEPGSLRLGQC